MPRAIPISGIGIVSPFGTTHAAFRTALLEGRTGIAAITTFGVGDCRSTLAARVTGFEASTFVHPMKLRRVDRTGALAFAAAQLALADAGVSFGSEGDDRTGVVVGTWTAGGHATLEYLDALHKLGPIGTPALLFSSTVGNAAASFVGLEFKLRGPNATISQKEASGLAALVAGAEWLRAGRADGLVAGGVDDVPELFFKAHDRFAVMSPATMAGAATAPFDAARSGFVLGEGGFLFWMGGAVPADGEPRDYGQVLGVSATSAAVAVNAWPDRSQQMERNMRLALADAGVAAPDIDVVYASANAAPAFDAVEARALVNLFGDTATVVTAVKGALGESGASGAAAVAAALLCGGVGQVPPIAGLEQPDEACGGLRLARHATPAPGPLVLVNSVASGGALFSLVLRVTMGRPAAS